MRTVPERNSSPLSLENLTLNEVTCNECGKPSASIPSWLSSARVKFQCEECRQKHPRVPGMVELETRRTVADVEELGGVIDIAEEIDGGDAEEEVGEEVDDYAE